MYKQLTNFAKKINDGQDYSKQEITRGKDKYGNENWRARDKYLHT